MTPPVASHPMASRETGHVSAGEDDEMRPVAMHPEPVPHDPAALRWVVGGAQLSSGLLTDAPGRLGEMLHAQVISKAIVEPGAVWLWVADGSSWHDIGAETREALTEALSHPELWTIVADDDQVLRLVATDVISGQLADWIASHGGRITLVDAGHDTIKVSLEGNCKGCPAAGLTMHGRIQTAVSKRLGRAVSVTACTPPVRHRWGRRNK